MRPCTPHYVLTPKDSIVLGKHFFSSSTALASCHGVVHALVADHLITNTSHGETLHCLIAMLPWWTDIRKCFLTMKGCHGLDCECCEIWL